MLESANKYPGTEALLLCELLENLALSGET